MPDRVRRRIDPVVSLDDERAKDARLCGAKAGRLARARSAGLPVVPGVVIVTDAAGGMEGPDWDPIVTGEVRTAWEALSKGGAHPLIVRSSSVAEDQQQGSMAGRFRSVAGVTSWDEFRGAVREVVASRHQVSSPASPPGGDPIAVLVQPMVDPRASGVMFGADPVTGRSDRIVIEAVAGAPEDLVSGAAEGARYEVGTAGEVHARPPRGGGPGLRRRDLRALAKLAGEVAATFGGPQDVEWAIDRHGAPWLLQSRPVTSEVRGVPAGPVLGPGPLSETFPEPLAPLEEDLWLQPVTRALRTALQVAGLASKRRLDRSPVVVSVQGRPAVDLDLFGDGEADRKLLQRLGVSRRLRRLLAAWRVGRLRAALPDLAGDLIERTDGELLAVPPLAQLTDRQLVGMLARCREALAAIHGHEVLIGLVIDPGTPRLTAAGVALQVLAEPRDDGASEGELAKRHPIVLALVPPRIQARVTLPPVEAAPAGRDEADRDHDRAAVLREALRLRARWVQELSARAAWALGERLAERGALDEPSLVRGLRFHDLEAHVAASSPRPLRPSLVAAADLPDPLPAKFRMSDRGLPVPLLPTGEHPGTGAGGGIGTGRVHQGADPPEGAVLVTRTLDPALAPVLPRLAGLVAETGSVLAHVAILAREAGVPTVVGLAGAADRYPPGTAVRVDGDTGEVLIVEEDEQ